MSINFAAISGYLSEADMSLHTACWTLVLCALGITLPQSSSGAQDRPRIRDTLVIDHVKRAAWFVSGSSRRAIKEGEKVRVRPSKHILVIVRETNSAIYDYSIKTERSGAPEMAVLRTYLSSLGPYALDLNTLLLLDDLPRARSLLWLPPTTGCAPAANLREQLTALDRYVRGGTNAGRPQLVLCPINE